MANILDFNNALREKELADFLSSDKGPDRDMILSGLVKEVEQFAAWLFPAAVITPRNVRVGNVHGSPGTSLVVETKGDKRGLWKDFADPSQKGGNLIDLYIAHHGVNFAQALDELADWVGHGSRPEISYSREQAVRKLKKVERDLGPQKGEWHYTDADGDIIATVYRFEPEPGQKEFLPWDAEKHRYGNPDIRPLYNLPGILRGSSVVFCEGEKAAQALIERGIEATCVMGGSNSPLERSDLEPLKGKQVTIWPDNDDPGRKFGAALAQALKGVAATIEFIDPPKDAPQGWDAADTDTPEQYLGQAHEPTAEQMSPLPLEWAGEVEPVIDGFWLIDDWLPANGIAAIYGHPGSGKSFFALHMAAHIASGREWAGRHVERGLVVYVVAEGATGFRNRMHAMRENGDIAPDAPLAYVASPIDMQAENGDTDALILTIQAALDVKGIKPALIVLDTLSKTFGGGKENTDDMVGYVNNCQQVASAFDCLTCVVHHRPKDSESKDLRGHSSLRGNVDTTILVEAGDIKTATTLKQKDGEDNMQVRFRLDRTVIGHDRRGKEVSTCLVSITENHPKKDEMAGLSPKEVDALMVLFDLCSDPEIDPETGEISTTPAAVSINHWRDALGQEGTLSRDNIETAKKQFQRLRKALQNKEKITIEGGLVYPKGTLGDKQ